MVVPDSRTSPVWCGVHIYANAFQNSVGPNDAQTTLRQPITCGGTGVHSGRDVTLTLRPASAHHGVVFRRMDITDRENGVAARWDKVADTQMCTVLRNAAGVRVSTLSI